MKQQPSKPKGPVSKTAPKAPANSKPVDSKALATTIPKKQQALSFEYKPNELKNIDFNKVFTDQQRNKQKEIYTFYDLGLKGQVKREELPFMLRACGVLISTYEVRQLADLIDSEKTGFITFRQFQAALYTLKEKQPIKEEVEGCLKIFDKLKNNQVDINELKSTLMNMGDIVTEREFEIILKSVKLDQGMADLNEILKILMIQPK